MLLTFASYGKYINIIVEYIQNSCDIIENMNVIANNIYLQHLTSKLKIKRILIRKLQDYVCGMWYYKIFGSTEMQFVWK